MLYVKSKTYRADGTADTFYTTECEERDSPLWWQTQGLSFNASGYGARIPTRRMVKFNGRWRRVYCRIYSNSGTLYIGRLKAVGETHIVMDCK